MIMKTVPRHLLSATAGSSCDAAGSSVYLQNREGGGARARRAPLHSRRAPYGRHWRDFSEEVFVVGESLRAPRPEKPLEGLSGVTFCLWRAPEGALQLCTFSL